MTPLARLDASSLALTTGIIAGTVALAAGAEGAAPPEWIKITPAGKATTRDGRSFAFDPARLAARFRTDGTDLAVDTDHSVALLASKGERPNVVGYVKAVEARQDGTYGRVEWLDAAAAAATLRTHRYVSPTMHHDAAGNVTWLHSVALVSAPALGNMPALAAAPAGGNLATLAGALNLPETADEATILAAIGGMVPKATHDATLAALTAATEQLAGLTATTRKTDVDATVDKAMRELKITPAQRDSYLAMCATEAGLEAFRGLMAVTAPMFRPSGLDGKTAPGSDRPATAQAIIQAAKLYQAERAQAGLALTMAEAINAVADRGTA